MQNKRQPQNYSQLIMGLVSQLENHKEKWTIFKATIVNEFDSVMATAFVVLQMSFQYSILQTP